ncbi:epimerase [Mucilaginibacter phyllosphaerae]
MKGSKLKVIITGSTGMVGEGVLQITLDDHNIDSVLVINRHTVGFSHPKMIEILHSDLSDISTVKASLKDYDSCFFCLGTTSVGKTEELYNDITYNLTLKFARILYEVNCDMTFCYVSGAATDSTEKGSTMWARVKGKTENDLMKVGFRDVYCFRPGLLLPIKGAKNTHPFYKFLSWLFPFGRLIFPDWFCSLNELALAMIKVGRYGYSQKIFKGRDIIELARS